MPPPNLMVTEVGKDVETLRYQEETLIHAQLAAQTLVIPSGPFDVDFDVRSLVVTPGTKPAANAANFLDVWAGPPGSVSDVQTITVTATGGTFRIGFGGGVIPAQPWNVANATLQTALRLLPAFEGTGVTVTGVPGTNIILTFGGPLANELMPLVTIDASQLTGGSMTLAHTTPGVGQRLAPRQVDANWVANTPYTAPVGQAPHAAPRIAAGRQNSIQVSFNGDDSAAPAVLCVHFNLEIPIYDQSAKVNTQLAYSRSV